VGERNCAARVGDIPDQFFIGRQQRQIFQKGQGRKNDDIRPVVYAFRVFFELPFTATKAPP